MTKNPFDYSRKFDPYTIIDDPDLDKAIKFLTDEIRKNEIRKRKRTEKEAAALHTHMKAVVSDLYAAWHYDPKLYLGISRAKETYRLAVSRYQPIRLSYTPIIDVLDGLSSSVLGYIEQKKGYYDFPGKRLTRIRATKKLITILKDDFDLPAKFKKVGNQETIILKDKNKDKMDYTDSVATRRMRDSLKTINEMLQRAQSGLDLTTKQRENLEKDLKRKIEKGENVNDFTRARLIRVFNQGSFRKGGRFYGGWWMSIPKEYRKYIKIDGSKTIELDYNCLNPNLLYSLEGAQLKGDAYTLPGYDPAIYREEIKKAFYKLLFTANGKKLSFKDIPLLKNSETSESLERALRDRHPIIEKYFRKSCPHHFQYLDSCITESILLSFCKLNKSILPIHDGYIVQQNDDQLLRRVMQEAYQKIMKVAYCIDIN